MVDELLNNVYRLLKDCPLVCTSGLSYRLYTYNDFGKTWILRAAFSKKIDCLEYMGLLLSCREVVRVNYGKKLLLIRLGGRVYGNELE